MKIEESYHEGRIVVVHLGVILDFYQSSQSLEVGHMICPNI